MAGTFEDDLLDDQIRTNAFDPVLLSRLMAYIRPRMGMAAGALVLTLLSALFVMVAPLLVAAAVDVLFGDGGGEGSAVRLLSFAGLGPLIDSLRATISTADGDAARNAARATVLAWFVGGYVISVIAQFLVDWANGYLLARMSQNILYDIRMQLFRHILSRNLSFFHRNRVGRLITRVTNDVGALDEFFSQALLAVMKDLMLLAGIVVLLLIADWRLALITFISLPPMIVISLIFRHYSRMAYRKWRSALSNLNAVMAETANGVRVVQLFRRENRNQQKYEEVGEVYRREFLNQRRAWAWYRPGYTILQAASMGLVLWFGGAWVLNATYAAARPAADNPGAASTLVFSAGLLTLFVLLAEKFFQPIRDLVEKFDIIQGAVTSAERIFTVLDDASELPVKPGAIAAARLDGRIEFRDVHFAYNPTEPVLRGVSFTANPGEMIAIVGHTGAGKTTVISLLSRLYDVNAGAVLVDERDVRDYTPQSLRRNIAVVHQDVFLFAGTVRENLALGRPNASDEDIRAAARAVGVEEFILRHPDGYGQRVEEGGKTFSAGERQLLSFARALVADPAVLVLDEATSSIDTKSELLIQAAMKAVMRGRTSIVIAHRLSTIQTADRILVMHHGVVAESGRHQELLAHRGLYHKLYQLQFAGADTAPRSTA